MPRSPTELTELKQVLETTRLLVSQEFAIAGRIESKARYMFTTTAVWFLGVQAFAFRVWSTTAFALFFLAATCVFFWAAWRSTQVWKLRGVSEISPGLLRKIVDEEEKDIEGRLVNAHVVSLQNHREANKERSDAYALAERACGISIGAVFLEGIATFVHVIVRAL